VKAVLFFSFSFIPSHFAQSPSMAAGSSPNSTVQRAMEAEKKVERLERQLDALKSRLKVITALDESLTRRILSLNSYLWSLILGRDLPCWTKDSTYL
jgi:hypothetical protein